MQLQLKDSQTYVNLAKSYAGECQALVRYRFIKYAADQQDMPALGKLVDTVIYNEFHHARMFYTMIQGSEEKQIENIEITAGYPFKEKWNLLDNLRIAAEDELNEATLIYPEFSKVAKKEGFKEIAALYDNIIQVENCHNMLFKQLHEQMKNGTMYKKPQAVKWKCADCGYEATAKQAWDTCPLCKAKQTHVMIKIEDGAN